MPAEQREKLCPASGVSLRPWGDLLSRWSSRDDLMEGTFMATVLPAKLLSGDLRLAPFTIVKFTKDKSDTRQTTREEPLRAECKP